MYRSELSVRQVHQTDYRFADIVAWSEDRGRMVQSVNLFGCLFFSLLSICEHWVRRPLSVHEKRTAYHRLIQRNAGNEYRGMRPTCFVMSHEDVGMEGFDLLNARCRLVYIYNQPEGKDPAVFQSTYRNRENARIEQWAVQGSNSHFIHVSLGDKAVFDPYPGLILGKRLSVRGYFVENRP